MTSRGKVVLPKRASTCETYPNKFEFPGGKVEKDEELKEALVRELKEELDIDVAITNVFEFDKNVVKMNNIALTLFIVQEWKGNIELKPTIHSEKIEVDFEKLISIPELAETDKEIVPDLIQHFTDRRKILDKYAVKTKKEFLSKKNYKNEDRKNKIACDHVLLTDISLYDAFISSPDVRPSPKKKCPIRSRSSTMAAETCKKIAYVLDDKHTIPFTEEDRAMKKKIWEYKSGASAINNEQEANPKKGDHIWGLNEAPFIEMNGIKYKRIGSDSDWNRIPCTHKENVAWKRIKNIDGIKNIVYDFDTIDANQEIQDRMNDDSRGYFRKYKLWKEYCDSRGAKMFHKITSEVYNIIVVELAYQAMEILGTKVDDKISQYL